MKPRSSLLLVIVLIVSSLLTVSATSSADSSSISNRVVRIIESHNTVVFSKSYCRYSRAAKSLLLSIDPQTFILELDQDAEGSAIQEYLEELTGQRTVPNIFIHQNHIGGNDKVQALHQQSKLIPLINNNNKEL